ncbi:archaellin/type IV pilin N-terminal domain-containing protein [Methanococcus maripaludis]|uniref:Flagellin n=2 Tax=Methanococcus maripaludis TaxID=39152 RepID=A0A7J9PEI7_METMI|nr:archaellin/type IV pilin N-terminal domain-containing protein [Methanococcus maripaludis]MBA2861665.1 flagellin FlaB [Methanococcus maripaludis]
MKITKFMKSKKGASGIGTLIVFIAMVLVAAVAASVLINTSGFLQQKASTTGKESTDQVASGLQVDGVTGLASTTLDKMVVYITPNAGSAAIDLKETKIFVTYDDQNQVLSYDGLLAASADGDIFSSTAALSLTTADVVVTRGGDRITIVTATDVSTLTEGTAVTLAPATAQSVDDVWITGIADIDGVTGTVISSTGAGPYTLVIALDSDDATTLVAIADGTKDSIKINGIDNIDMTSATFTEDANDGTVIAITGATAEDIDTDSGLSNGDTASITLDDGSIVSAVSGTVSNIGDDTITITAAITAVTEDETYTDTTGSLSGTTVWDGVDASSFKILVLQGTVTDGVIDKGDLVGVAIDTNAIFGGIPNREAVSAKLQPEFGAPGIVSFTTPATYSTSIVELQ